MTIIRFLIATTAVVSLAGCSTLALPSSATPSTTQSTAIDSFEQSSEDLGNKLSLESQINQLFKANQTTGDFYYPVANYSARRRTGVFSQYVPDHGYLTGDHIILKDATTPVPVVALTDAEVVWKDILVDYGGTVILAFTLDGVVYHALYSGLDLATVTVNVTDQVSAGSQLGDLAGDSTRELHFTIYPYTTAELFTMYASIDGDLTHWVDPATFLRGQKAQNLLL